VKCVTQSEEKGRRTTLTFVPVLFLCMELLFQIVKVAGAGDEVIAATSNFLVARAAFDTCVSLWPAEAVELRQGARIIKSMLKTA
jgi:hypothetical protein